MAIATKLTYIIIYHHTYITYGIIAYGQTIIIKFHDCTYLLFFTNFQGYNLLFLRKPLNDNNCVNLLH